LSPVGSSATSHPDSWWNCGFAQPKKDNIPLPTPLCILILWLNSLVFIYLIYLHNKLQQE
jgi:hypothetical protein